jgi:hypothetical protein
MKKIHLICLLFLMQTGIAFAQAPVVSDDYKKTVSFLQGDGITDSGPMEFVEELRKAIIPIFNVFIKDAQALAAVFMIIFFALKSYEMMSGDKQLEVMPLLRPFGLLMIIIWWGTFVQIVAYPTEVIARKAKEKFLIEQAKVNDLRFRRAELQMRVVNELYSLSAEAEVAKNDAEKANEDVGFLDSAWDDFKGAVINPVIEYQKRVEISMKLLATQIAELFGLWTLRTGVFLIFIIQVIYASILIILGPFAVAASILPAFRDSLSTWIARFISVNLYLGIGYIIMLLVTVFQNFAMKSEIAKYQELVGLDGMSPNAGALAVFNNNGLLSFGTVIVSYLIGAIAMFTVPSISTWIISTSGISSAASTAGRAAAGAGQSAGAAVSRAFTKV